MHADGDTVAGPDRADRPNLNRIRAITSMQKDGRENPRQRWVAGPWARRSERLGRQTIPQAEGRVLVPPTRIQDEFSRLLYTEALEDETIAMAIARSVSLPAHRI